MMPECRDCPFWTRDIGLDPKGEVLSPRTTTTSGWARKELSQAYSLQAIGFQRKSLSAPSLDGLRTVECPLERGEGQASRSQN